MTEEAGEHTGASRQAEVLERLAPWAWVPAPVTLAAISVFWLLDWRSPHENLAVLLVLNFLFVTLAAAVVAVIAARSFVTTGNPGTLLFGSGTLVMGAAFVAAPAVGRSDPNDIATIHNLGMLASGVLQLGGALASRRRLPAARAPRLLLAIAYALAIGFVLVVADLAARELTPVFFVPGRGGTPVRQAVLVAAALLLATAGTLLVTGRTARTGFDRLYGSGLLLLAVGLAGVTVQHDLGSPISWTGRFAQYLGGAWLAASVVAEGFRTRRWALPLEAELRELTASSRQLAEARAQLALAFAASNDGLWDWNVKTGQVDFDERWAGMFGYRRSELAPDLSTWRAMVHPDEREAARVNLSRILAGESDRYEVERRLRHRDGHWVWVHVRGKVVERDRSGKPTRMCGTYTDISARRAIEDELRATKERLSFAIDGSGDGFWDWDVPSGRVKFSRRWASMLGYDLAELEPDVSTWRRLVHPEDLEAVSATLDSHLRGDTDQYEIEHRLRHKDGRWVWVHDRGRVVARDEHGRPVRMAGTHTDVSRRKEAEARLAESEERLRSVLAAMAEGVVMQDASGRIVFCNTAAEDILGLTRSQMDGRTSVDPGWRSTHEDGSPFPGEDHPATVTLRTGKPTRGSMMGVVRPDGAQSWIRINSEPLHARGGSRPAAVVTTFTDVTRIREAQMRLATFVDQMPTAVAMFDREMRCLAASSEWLRMHGLAGQDVTGRRYYDLYPLIPEAWRAMHRRCLAGAVERSDEDRFPRPGGSFDWVRWETHPWRDASGEIGGIVVFAEVTTSRRALQEQMAVTSRLTAMGTLVAGLAHEVNNPLAAEVAGQGLALEVARAARHQLATGAPIDVAANIRELDFVIDALEDAQEAGQRVAGIVRDMAAFARPESSRSRARLRDVVDQGLRWVPASLTTTADLEVEDGGPPEVMASTGQLAQVVLNLVTNALKATPAGGRGKVALRLGRGPAGQATLEVSDQGIGIAPEIRGRIFEPFFTTRASGAARGTGLGLAVCHSIVTSHGGTITVESEVGKGSTFRVELPAAAP